MSALLSLVVRFAALAALGVLRLLAPLTLAPLVAEIPFQLHEPNGSLFSLQTGDGEPPRGLRNCPRPWTVF
jgi:hypothetical protein